MKNKFSKPIQADDDAFYMSCPEIVGKYIAEKISEYNSCVELCCAVGALSVQLAKKIKNVYAVDIDPKRIAQAKLNAELYGVNNITFIIGDVLSISLLKSIKADVAILDPDWSSGGRLKSDHVSCFEGTQPNLKEMFDLTQKYITKNIIIRAPKTFSVDLLSSLGKCKVENIIWNNSVKFKIVYYFGDYNVSEKDVDFGNL